MLLQFEITVASQRHGTAEGIILIRLVDYEHWTYLVLCDM